MDDENERPGLFNLWPSVTFINCPKCGTHWVEPRFGSKDAVFPPFDCLYDEREPIQRAHCPRCGDLLPTIDDLSTTEHAVGRPPIKGKPFVGTISGIQGFLEQSAGAHAQLWRYFVSHSNLILKLDSTTNDTHAFVVCTMTVTLVLPKLHWRSSLVLQSTHKPDYWALRDEAAGVEIVAAAIGIFHDVEALW